MGCHHGALALTPSALCHLPPLLLVFSLLPLPLLLLHFCCPLDARICCNTR